MKIVNLKLTEKILKVGVRIKKEEAIERSEQKVHRRKTSQIWQFFVLFQC